MIATNIERHSATWRAIERELTERRATAVQALIQGSSNDDKRRGEIALIDSLLELGRPDAEPPPPPVTY